MLKLSQISFSGKIVGLVLFTVIVVGSAAFGSAYYFFTRSFDEQAERRIDLTSTAVQGTLDDLADKIKKLAISFSTRPDLAEAVEKKDTRLLQKIGKELMTDNGLEVLTIADIDGNVVARGHSEKTGDSVANQVNVKKALAGEVSVGIEVGTVVAFSLRAGAPVKIDDRIVGTITPGIDLTTKTTFVDEIKKRFGVECTIFKGDERVSTTLEKDGRRLVGTKMDNPKVIDTVLRKGLKYLHTNLIKERVYNTAYWPIIGTDANSVGMLFIGNDRSSIEKAYRTVIMAVLISVLTIGLLMVAAGYFLSRSLVGPMLKSISSIDKGVNEVSIAANQVASSSQQLAEGASEQAASIEETSSSLEEMSSMTKQNADNARQADQLMASTKESVSRSTQIMDQLTTSMGEISKSSEKTSKIIRTIDEIAFQTNLLALNAAVEAARAGETGAGFAVVADEVRNLALRAAEAAKNTADLIEGTVRKIKEGSELVEKADAEFRQVALNVERSGELVGQISAASAEQSQGIEQINKAVSEMDKVVQQNAGSAEESASASEDMNAQANRMKGLVENLVTVVGGRSSGRAKRSDHESSKKGKGSDRISNVRLGKPVNAKTTSKINSNGGMNHSSGGNIRPSKLIPFDEEKLTDF
jgi:methyl-accepting chemotaxis protein